MLVVPDFATAAVLLRSWQWSGLSGLGFNCGVCVWSLLWSKFALQKWICLGTNLFTFHNLIEKCLFFLIFLYKLLSFLNFGLRSICYSSFDLVEVWGRIFFIYFNYQFWGLAVDCVIYRIGLIRMCTFFTEKMIINFATMNKVVIKFHRLN